MKCEICKKNEAQFYYKESINGKTTEKHLCAEVWTGSSSTRRTAC